MFDDIEEDALVGPLLEDEQLMMGHGGGEGSSEVSPIAPLFLNLDRSPQFGYRSLSLSLLDHLSLEQQPFV